MSEFSNKSVLVTGANSGLGFEAAAQLAEAGYGRIVLACRSVEKAKAARKALVERTGRDPFELLEVDVSSVESAQRAARELKERNRPLDALLLNAGMVSGEQMRRSKDGLEESFAASIVGHHVLALRLLEDETLTAGGRIVIAGSEGANNDAPAAMDMKLYDFAVGQPHEFGEDLRQSMLNFAAGDEAKFNPFRQYAVTKLFVAWWSAAMARRFGDRVQVFTVSPGASMRTNAGRHIRGLKGFMFNTLMPLFGPLVGMHQPVDVAAKRYIDVLLDRKGAFQSGRTYTSPPKKFVGPLQVVDYPHVNDRQRQEVAWGVLGELTGVGQGPRVVNSAAG